MWYLQVISFLLLKDPVTIFSEAYMLATALDLCQQSNLQAKKLSYHYEW
jgi:hypothetical protein